MFYVIIAVTALQAVIVATASRTHRLFLSVLLACQVYFCIGGYWYWIVYSETYFVGTVWGVERMQEAAVVFSVAIAAVASVVWLADRLSKPRPAPPIPISRDKMRRGLLVAHVLYWIGLLAAAIVVLNANSAEAAVRQDQAGVFLIAFQFSDLMIPALLFLIAQRGFTTMNLGRAALFLAYAVFSGLRYRIVLLVVPLLILKLLQTEKLSKRIALGAALGVAMLALFSIMTLFRSKFSGLDFSTGNKDYLFGIFAEANVLFGLSSVLRGFVDRGISYPLDPLMDTIYGFIPRFLLPSRKLSSYLIEQSNNMLTYQGSHSGTAYPFIGEFAVMGGWPAMVLGAVIYPLLYLWLMRAMRLTAPNPRGYIGGVALLAIFMGYYNLSRGYLPQLSKGYFFIIAPYLWVCWLSRPKLKRVAAAPFRARRTMV